MFCRALGIDLKELASVKKGQERFNLEDEEAVIRMFDKIKQ